MWWWWSDDWNTAVVWITLTSVLLLLLLTIYRYYRRVGLVLNWSGEVEQTPTHIVKPKSTDEVIRIVRKAYENGEKIKVCGALHSWSDVAAVGQGPVTTLLNLDHLNQMISINLYDDDDDDDDNENENDDNDDHNDMNESGKFVGTVTVQAGMRLKDLLQELDTKGLTLLQLGSITEQSIAGLISTGTHGSSFHIGNIASCVTSLEIVTGKGDVMHLSDVHHADIFKAARIGLGALGVITKVELKVVKAFYLHVKEQPMKLKDVLERAENMIREANYSKLWYFPFSGYVQVFTMNRLPLDPSQWTQRQRDVFYRQSKLIKWIDEKLIQSYLLRVILWTVSFFPVIIPSLNKFLRKMGWVEKEYIGKSHHILPILHDIPIHSEGEISIPTKYWKDAVKIIAQQEKRFIVDFIAEFRFSSPDDAWMSPSYNQDSCYSTYMCYRLPREPFFRNVEKNFLELQSQHSDCLVRPHWGKTFFSFDAKHLSSVLPKYEEFKSLMKLMDPKKIFHNRFLQQVFGD